jgi:PEP-CTERM motif
MRTIIGFAIVATIAFTGSLPAAAATIYTSRAAFNAATSGQTVSNFEENAPGGITAHSGFSGPSFAITSAGFTIYTIDPAAAGGLYDFGTGDVLDVEFANTTITVDPSVTAFGFDYAPLRLVGGNFVTIDSVNYTNSPGRTFNFFGIVGAGPLGPLLIGWNGGPNIIDNFTTASAAANGAVPEPAAWTMMLAGFGTVGGMMRSRRRKATLMLMRVII